jgi:Fe-S oxidoreductase
MDLAGGAILLGVIMAAFRRSVLRPDTLGTQWDDYYALLILGMIPIVGFTTEGLRLLSTNPEWARWSPIGNAMADLLRSINVSQATAGNTHIYFFWFHVILGLTFIASIPFTKLRHLVVTPINLIFRNRRKDGVLEKIEDIEEAEILGVGKISEFSSQQLLSFDACLRCGRCEEVCPAAISGMQYSPKDLIQTLRNVMISSLVKPNGNGYSSGEIFTEGVAEELPWACTTCGACLKRCPAFINPVDEIIDLRRYQVLMSGEMPKTVGETLRNFERQGNPWGMPPENRLAWAEGLNVRELAPGDETDILLFVGCALAYDERNKKVARSFAQILHQAGVDFGILGFDEICCGETARRMGHEYLFQVFAEQNIEMFSNVKFNRIVTQCPHCFNTLKNEYPQMGGAFKIQHYSEYLSELFAGQKKQHTNRSEISTRVTYHDSCYLGRYNNIYSAPRQILEGSNIHVTEMSRKGADGFCCGGGGGGMWMETDANTRINNNRLNDALDAHADVIATACPYCLLMFDDAIRTKGIGENIQVMDISELLIEHKSASGEE